jgi:glycosyltransferase involved in cell wall biosynthesis
MNVLMVSGDKGFGPGHPRYDLMRQAVDRLEIVYVGRGRFWPTIPPGPFDVVTAQDPLWRGCLAWWLSRRFKAKLNLQVHADMRSYSRIFSWWAGCMLRKAQTVRVVSDEIKERVWALGATASVTVLPVFVDVSRFQRLTREPHEGLVVLWIGRFEKEKDPLQAIEIFKEVLGKHVQAKLIMLGKGSLDDVLKARAAGLPITFPGWQDSAPYLSKADVVLSTSRYESWGASIVEALAAGVPVVAPDVGVAEAAGATVAERANLASVLTEVLLKKPPGVLKLALPTREEWVEKWKKTLI